MKNKRMKEFCQTFAATEMYLFSFFFRLREEIYRYFALFVLTRFVRFRHNEILVTFAEYQMISSLIYGWALKKFGAYCNFSVLMLQNIGQKNHKLLL